MAVWGTSSGANAALLTGLTIDDDRYETGDYEGESDSVTAVVSCFAPTDIDDVFDFSGDTPGSDVLEYALFGFDKSKWPEKKAAMSPLKQVQRGKDYPAFLLFHGDADTVVPYHEMEDMYSALSEAGAEVEAYRVKGADHEKDFWSPKIYQVARHFLDERLKPTNAD